jgi:hypothetical protein
MTDREARLMRIVRTLAERAGAVERRLVMSPGKTVKASSAEAILRLCLRMTGLTRRYRTGTITAAQRRRVLRAIVEYGRAWLRHEAEAFLLHHVPGSVNRAWGKVPAAIGGHLDRFFRRAKQFVRETIVAGAMALLGPAPLTSEDLEAADRQAQRQEQFFDRFADRLKQTGLPATPPPPPKPGEPPVPLPLEPPPITPRQFAARADQYGSAPWGVAHSLERARKQREGYRFERWVLGQVERHCPTCPERAAQGWRPIGTFPDIGLPLDEGGAECGQSCRCHLDYAMTLEGERAK